MDSEKLKLLPNMKCYFKEENNKKKTLKYLGEKNKIFWDYISLAVYTQKIIEEDKGLVYPSFAMSYLFFKFINHIVTSYDLLLQNMQEEFFVMLRQSFEVLWLLKYFVKYPQKEKEWIKKSFPQNDKGKIDGIHPHEVRRGFPEEKETMEYIYNNLSNFVHSNNIAFMNGIGLGGFYDEWFIDLSISKVIISVDDMLQLLYNILKMDPNKYLISDEKKLYIVRNDLIKNTLLVEKLINSIEIYRELVPDLWKLQINKDYEKEALEELISLGYIKVK